MCLGAGAAGILLTPVMKDGPLWGAAVLAGLAFNFLIVRPLFSFGLKFASTPSEGLEGLVATPAEAISRFDATGRGLVKLNLDGEVVQLLARLSSDERDRGITVQKGEQVLLIEVNAKTGTCEVSKEMSP